MVTIIVAAHGESAPALLKTAGMILGNFENVHPVTFLPGQGPEDLVEEYTRIVEASEAEETLLLVDLFGGSPYNAGAQFAATREGVDVVSGVNVPMLIEVISGAGRKSATLKSLVAKAHKAGTKGIRSFQDANQPAAAKPAEAKPAEAKPAEAKAAEVPAAQQVPGGTMDAVFTRIDSRLIHGQVAGTWVPFIAPQTFIAASDNAAHDKLRKSLLLQVAPAGVKTNVLDIAKAGRVYNNPKYTGMKTMFVVESPVDVVRLLDEGVKINEVNVGGVTFKTGMVQLSDAVYASEEHLEAYRELLKRGVKLTVQQLPNHSPVDLAKILKQKGLDA
ncbi:PTS mannose transporter subunit EIIAB [Rothia sp. HMSC062F03]|uniref:mannose/fructose/sorbose PTS transporter subunit IIA n=1 Tax=Rothia sp. HMSC062F03 TaxID=1715153 RepID=UPI0008A9A35F|nr:mannose/fructose/sorbose PTS transporter subunit IIA [Rothia sp. HMSC062F03]OHP73221.1 PTS mannose transporter subunit EIIAB [Rothia sp. HMSC062F03]